MQGCLIEASIFLISSETFLIHLSSCWSFWPIAVSECPTIRNVAEDSQLPQSGLSIEFSIDFPYTAHSTARHVLFSLSSLPDLTCSPSPMLQLQVGSLVTIFLTLQLPLPDSLSQFSHTCVRTNSYDRALISIIFMIVLPQCPCTLDYISKSKNFICPTYLSCWHYNLKTQPHPRVSDSIHLWRLSIPFIQQTWFCHTTLLEQLI